MKTAISEKEIRYSESVTFTALPSSFPYGLRTQKPL